jgi:L-arginine dehydrogenase
MWGTKRDGMNVSLWSEEDISRRADQLDVKGALRDAFAGLLSGTTVQPPQTVAVMAGDAGDCIYYPGILADKGLIGCKLSPYLAERSRRGQYPVTAYTLILSASTGEPVLLCDSLLLTTIRTAATTSLALDYLIPDDARTLCVVGAGKVGLAHLRFALAQHEWSAVRVFSPSLADPAAPANAARREALDALGVAVETHHSARAAVEGADVVLCCTSSGTPVVEREWLRDRVVVTSVSTNVPRAHEIDPAWLDEFDVFCDYRQTCPLSAGEMVIAREERGWDPAAIVADLPELVTGKHPGVEASSGRVFFRSIGLGLEDLAIAGLLLEQG